MTTIRVESPEEFVSKGVELIEEAIAQGIAERGHAIVGLSGGSTPFQIYKELGTSARLAQFGGKFSFFLVDDRYIDAQHKDSNQTLLRNTLLAGNIISKEHLVVADTSLPLPDCIKSFEQQFVALLERSGGRADLVTLGMGPDGHIASLFPDPAVTPEGLASSPAVIHTTTERFAVHNRITVTLPHIVSARAALVFLKGREKQAVWDEMVADTTADERRWPAKAVLAAGHCSLLSLL